MENNKKELYLFIVIPFFIATVSLLIINRTRFFNGNFDLFPLRDNKLEDSNENELFFFKEDDEENDFFRKIFFFLIVTIILLLIVLTGIIIWRFCFFKQLTLEKALERDLEIKKNECNNLEKENDRLIKLINSNIRLKIIPIDNHPKRRRSMDYVNVKKKLDIKNYRTNQGDKKSNFEKKTNFDIIDTSEPLNNVNKNNIFENNINSLDNNEIIINTNDRKNSIKNNNKIIMPNEVEDYNQYNNFMDKHEKEELISVNPNKKNQQNFKYTRSKAKQEIWIACFCDDNDNKTLLHNKKEDEKNKNDERPRNKEETFKHNKNVLRTFMNQCQNKELFSELSKLYGLDRGEQTRHFIDNCKKELPDVNRQFLDLGAFQVRGQEENVQKNRDNAFYNKMAAKDFLMKSNEYAEDNRNLNTIAKSRDREVLRHYKHKEKDKDKYNIAVSKSELTKNIDDTGRNTVDNFSKMIRLFLIKFLLTIMVNGSTKEGQDFLTEKNYHAFDCFLKMTEKNKETTIGVMNKIFSKTEEINEIRDYEEQARNLRELFIEFLTSGIRFILYDIARFHNFSLKILTVQNKKFQPVFKSTTNIRERYKTVGKTINKLYKRLDLAQINIEKELTKKEKIKNKK